MLFQVIFRQNVGNSDWFTHFQSPLYLDSDVKFLCRGKSVNTLPREEDYLACEPKTRSNAVCRPAGGLLRIRFREQAPRPNPYGFSLTPSNGSAITPPLVSKSHGGGVSETSLGGTRSKEEGGSSTASDCYWWSWVNNVLSVFFYFFPQEHFIHFILFCIGQFYVLAGRWLVTLFFSMISAFLSLNQFQWEALVIYFTEPTKIIWKLSGFAGD